MEPVMILGIVLLPLVFVGARLVSARRAAAGDSGLEWLSVLPQGAGAVIFIWLGVRMTTTNPVIGVALLAIGLVGLILVIRAGRTVSRPAPTTATTGDVPGSMLDLIVWSVLVVPLLLGGVLVVMAIAGRLGS